MAFPERGPRSLRVRDVLSLHGTGSGFFPDRFITAVRDTGYTWVNYGQSDSAYLSEHGDDPFFQGEWYLIEGSPTLIITEAVKAERERILDIIGDASNENGLRYPKTPPGGELVEKVLNNVKDAIVNGGEYKPAFIDLKPQDPEKKEVSLNDVVWKVFICSAVASREILMDGGKPDNPHSLLCDQLEVYWPAIIKPSVYCKSPMPNTPGMNGEDCVAWLCDHMEKVMTGLSVSTSPQSAQHRQLALSLISAIKAAWPEVVKKRLQLILGAKDAD